MIDQPLPVAAALAGIADDIALTREVASADRRRPSGPNAVAPASRRGARTGRRRPACAELTPDAWAASLAAISTHTKTLSDVATALTAERGEAADSELVVWAEATNAAVRQPPPRPRGAASSTRVGDGFPTIADLSDPPVWPQPATVPRRRRRWCAGCRRSPTRRRQYFDEMDFTFLFDPTRKLFSIGFRVLDGSLDPSYYDLLASEARLASFLAIAKGDVAPDHWFRLGRSLTPVGRGSALISWSGSMFEYLMPDLVMRSPANSLLEQTNRLVVARQIHYAGELGVPWGISESGFNARDLAQTYQYSSFGVPGLGLKRGLSEDTVVAPYATGLAAMIQPGGRGPQLRPLARCRCRKVATASARRSTTPLAGFPKGRRWPIVKSYMAHHQGMALVALGNVLNNRVDGRALPRRPDGRGNRAAAAGAHAARRARRPTTRRRSEEQRRRARPRAADAASLHLAARRHPADAPAVERAIRGDGRPPPAPATADGATSPSLVGART